MSHLGSYEDEPFLAELYDFVPRLAEETGAKLRPEERRTQTGEGLGPLKAQSASAVAIAAILATSHADAASSCNQSPLDRIPLVSMLAIQHTLAAV